MAVTVTFDSQIMFWMLFLMHTEQLLFTWKMV